MYEILNSTIWGGVIVFLFLWFLGTLAVKEYNNNHKPPDNHSY